MKQTITKPLLWARNIFNLYFWAKQFVKQMFGVRDSMEINDYEISLVCFELKLFQQTFMKYLWYSPEL